MNKLICDDRLDMEKLAETISTMTDEEFKQYTEEQKKSLYSDETANLENRTNQQI